MPRRVVLSLAVGVVVLGGAGAFAVAYAGNQPPVVAHSTARYTAPDAGRDGSLTFRTEVTASSGVKSVRVLAYPASSSLAEKEPTAKEMAAAEPAGCKPVGEDTVRCTYTVQVSAAEAASSPHGPWRFAVLATAADGGTALDTQAAGFTVR
ncbi:DUF5707 domain-containing protein [Streptomyces sp. NPDC046832]|uniref:DUF5707 domain-containing protein n=1 Tax=Streptomyces sp. NPDC046832 TaxID=3155020 RepID=UPI0033C58E13